MKIETTVSPTLMLIAAVCCLIGQTNCSSRVPEKPAVKVSTAEPNFNACELISGDEIEAVQGEKVKDSKNSSKTSGSLVISQCFYQLPTYSNSVSFEVTRAADKSEVRRIWQETFGGKNVSESEEREKEDREENSDEGKPQSERLQAVPNLGEAAFRDGNQISNALYVLKSDTIIRISIGGADDEKKKLEKSKILVQKALNRIG